VFFVDDFFYFHQPANEENMIFSFPEGDFEMTSTGVKIGIGSVVNRRLGFSLERCAQASLRVPKSVSTSFCAGVPIKRELFHHAIKIRTVNPKCKGRFRRIHLTTG
jgi:hypothetical protein